MLRDGFDDIAQKAWVDFRGFGTPDTYLKSKLKFLKNEIKKWRASNHPKEMQEFQQIKVRMQELDLAAESWDLSNSKLEERRWGFKKTIELEKFALSDIKQRVKIKWTVDGDENSSFFHGFINNKKRKNTISGLSIDAR